MQLLIGAQQFLYIDLQSGGLIYLLGIIITLLHCTSGEHSTIVIGSTLYRQVVAERTADKHSRWNLKYTRRCVIELESFSKDSRIGVAD